MQLFKQPVKIPKESSGLCLWESAICHFELLLPEQWDFNRPLHLVPAGGTAVPTGSPGSSAARCEGLGKPQKPMNPPQSILALL